MTKLTCIQSFLPLVLAVVAIVLGTAPSLNCETVEFQQADGKTILAGPISYRTRDTTSEWRTDYNFSTDSCHNYGSLRDGLDTFEYVVDAKTRTVWAFLILTPLLGALVIVQAFLAATCGSSSSPGFRGRSMGGWNCLGAGFLVTGLCQGITLLIDASSICEDNPALQYLAAIDPDLATTFPEPCARAAGYALTIVACVLWIVAGCFIVAVPAPVVIRERPPQDQTVTYARKPDGTVEEAFVAVVKGTPVPQSQSQ